MLPDAVAEFAELFAVLAGVDDGDLVGFATSCRAKEKGKGRERKK